MNKDVYIQVVWKNVILLQRIVICACLLVANLNSRQSVGGMHSMCKTSHTATLHAKGAGLPGGSLGTSLNNDQHCVALKWFGGRSEARAVVCHQPTCTSYKSRS